MRIVVTLKHACLVAALALSTEASFAQDQNETVKACAANVMTAFIKQKVAKISQDPKQLLSAENTLAERRAKEQYCLRYAECMRPLLPKSDDPLFAMAFGSMFSSCLEDEAKEKYDLQKK
jgi:activator of 2-hydroxyglutaryl-CoA dehydratase